MKSSVAFVLILKVEEGEVEENHEVVEKGTRQSRRKKFQDQIAPLVITTKTHMGAPNEKKTKEEGAFGGINENVWHQKGTTGEKKNAQETGL